MHLHPVDFVVIAAYFAGLFLLGFAFKKQESSDDYFLAGRRTSALLAGISVVATLLSTVSYIALPGEMIRHGVGYFTSLFAFVLIIPTVIYFLIPAVMRLPVTSIYDYLERRYDRRIRNLGAWVFVTTRMVWMGLILYMAARAVGPMTGWSLPLLVLLMGLVTVVYTTMGGMRAVVWSDFAQFVILFGGALLVPVVVAVRTESTPDQWWSVFSLAQRNDVPLLSFDPVERSSLVGMLLMVYVWNICTHTSDQVAAQRYLSTPSLKAARRSFWVFSVANVSLLLLLMFIGLALFYFQFAQAGMPIDQFQQEITWKADDVFPQFLAKELPTGLSGLMLAALLAAAMSSLSSGINSVSTVVFTDLLARQNVARSGGSVVTMPRVIAVTVGVVAIVGAILIDQLMQVTTWNLVDLMERVNHLFVAPLGALFFAGICFRHVGTGAVGVCFVAGLATSIVVAFSEWLFDYPISFMWIMPASLLVSLVTAGLTGWIFARPTATQLSVLYRQNNRAHRTNDVTTS